MTDSDHFVDRSMHSTDDACHRNKRRIRRLSGHDPGNGAEGYSALFGNLLMRHSTPAVQLFKILSAYFDHASLPPSNELHASNLRIDTSLELDYISAIKNSGGVTMDKVTRAMEYVNKLNDKELEAFIDYLKTLGTSLPDRICHHRDYAEAPRQE